MAPRRKRVASSEEEESSSSESDISDLSSSSSDEEEEESEVETKKRKTPAKKPAPKKPAPAKKKNPPPKKKPTPASSKKKTKLAQSSSSSEEEELGGSTTKKAAPTTTPMEEIEDPGYGSDLVKDEQDGLMLKAMDELEREKVLSERYEKRQAWKELVSLSGTTTAKKKAAVAKKAPVSKKATTTTTTATSTTTTTPAAPVVISSRMESESSSSSSSSESDSETERRLSKKRNQKIKSDSDDEDDLPPDHASPINFHWANKICITRTQVLQFLDYPKFRTGFDGCLLKVRTDNGEGYTLVRVEQVVWKDVVPYVVDKERVQIQFKVSSLGKLSVDRISNAPITLTEFDSWRMQVPLNTLKISDAIRTLRNFNAKLSNFVFSSEQTINKVKASQLRRQQHKSDAMLSSTNVGLYHSNPVKRKETINLELADLVREKQKLMKDLSSIKQVDSDSDNDEESAMDRIVEKIKRVNEQTSRLEQELERAEQLIQQRVKSLTHNQMVARLNQVNIESNDRDRAAAALAAASAQVTTIKHNPFVRRPTRPTVMWDVEPKRSTTVDAKGDDLFAEEESSQPIENPLVAVTSATAALEVVENGANEDNNNNELLEEEEEVKEVGGGREVLVNPVQVRLKLIPGAPIGKSKAKKKFSLEEYLKLKGKV